MDHSLQNTDTSLQIEVGSSTSTVVFNEAVSEARSSQPMYEILVVGDNPVCRLVDAALRACEMGIEHCRHLSMVLMTCRHIDADAVVMVREPSGASDNMCGHDIRDLLEKIRSVCAIILVMSPEDPLSEHEYLELGFDAVIPISELSNSICAARIRAVVRRTMGTQVLNDLETDTHYASISQGKL